MLLPLLLVLGQAAAPDGEPAPTGPLVLRLPAGPAAAAWSAVSAETVPRALPADDALPAAPNDARWHAAAPWERWAELVRAEALALEPDAARRAELARLALAMGRGDEAWAHFGACARDPGTVLALLPDFLFGRAGAALPRATSPGARGLALESGAGIRPALPPPSADAVRGLPDRRELVVERLPVGDALVLLRLELDPDGVQLEVQHLSGGAATLSVVLPVPADRETHAEYRDWEKLDTIGEPHVFELAPGGERQTAWARFRDLPSEWPTEFPEELTAQLRLEGLLLRTTASDPDRAWLAHAAAAFGRVLGAEARLSADLEEPAGGALELGLAPGPARARKLFALLGLAERFALERGAQGGTRADAR